MTQLVDNAENQQHLGIANGDRSRVIGSDDTRASVRLDSGKEVEIKKVFEPEKPAPEPKVEEEAPHRKTPRL